MVADVDCLVAFRTAVEYGRYSAPLPAHLRHSVVDPHAVTIRFLQDPSAVDWVFARSLLAVGVSEPTGAGDLRVFPGGSSPSVTSLVLSPPDGFMMLETPTTGITRFLGLTRSLVPYGFEATLDVDALLTEIGVA